MTRPLCPPCPMAFIHQFNELAHYCDFSHWVEFALVARIDVFVASAIQSLSARDARGTDVAIPADTPNGLDKDVVADDAQRRRLTDVILDYFEANPNAADTLDGVVMWWLGPNSSRFSRAEVLKALDALVEQGRVQRTAPAGGAPVYSLKTPRARH